MAKSRKMLGDIYSEECMALMQLIETQSLATLSRWSVSYAKEHYLPIYNKIYSTRSEMEELIQLCERHFAGEIKISEVKTALRDSRKIASETTDAVGQAAARAITSACAAIQTPTNAFGFLLYGAAAAAYVETGLDETPEVYDRLATMELKRALSALREVSVAEEPNPAKIKWNC